MFQVGAARVALVQRFLGPMAVRSMERGSLLGVRDGFIDLPQLPQRLA